MSNKFFCITIATESFLQVGKKQRLEETGDAWMEEWDRALNCQAKGKPYEMEIDTGIVSIPGRLMEEAVISLIKTDNCNIKKVGFYYE